MLSKTYAQLAFSLPFEVAEQNIRPDGPRNRYGAAVAVTEHSVT